MYIDISKYNLPKFRQEQVNTAIFRNFVSSIDEISNIPNTLKENLKKDFSYPSIQAISEVKNNEVIKKTFSTHDKKIFETVLILHKERKTICVSSQIGCGIGCKFCATGLSGFERNLNYQEIVDQVLHFAKNHKITNIVFMGMGEPFSNLENLEKSISILTNPEEFNISPRRITVSTVWVGNILDFVKKNPQINLAISLHSAIQAKRENLVPIAKNVKLQDIQDGLKEYFKISTRRITFEYLMLKEVNDTAEDMKELISFVKQINQKLIHINLLFYNDIGGIYESSTRKTILKSKNILERGGIKVTIRKSMGQDISSACGMLKQSTFLPQ